MRFEKEVHVRYSQVQAFAKRSVRVAKKTGAAVCPRELKYDMNDIKVASIAELGTVEIPVESIIGTTVMNEKGLYSPDFMPIASAGSPYAAQWCRLYMDYLSDEGWYAPIRCIEFLGRFYVEDGKKRVSVLKAHGAYTTSAIVTRILPVKTEEEVIQNYYSFLEDYEKTGLYQTEFTMPDGFAKLQHALGHEKDYVWNDQDRFRFLFNLVPVAFAMRSTFGQRNVSAADALVILLENYSYQEIRKMQPWERSAALQNAWMKLGLADYQDAAVEVVQKAS